jgi:hypothetical protein
MLSACCSLHQGNFESSASIQKGNFKIVKTASSSSSRTYLLGIGGLNSKGLFVEARNNLYEDAELEENQILGNVTVENEYTYILFPLLFQHVVYLTADVIEFTDEKEQPSKDSLKNNKGNISSTDTLETNLNDSLYNRIFLGSKIKFNDKDGQKCIGVVKKVLDNSYEVLVDVGFVEKYKIIVKKKDVIEIIK